MDSPPPSLREPVHPVSQSSPTPGTTPVNNNSGGGSGSSSSNNNSSTLSPTINSSNNSNSLMTSVSVSSNGLSALGPHGPSALAAHAAHAAAVAAAHAHNQAVLHGHHHNPLNLISKSLVAKSPASYGSPPPLACHPENNVCKLIEYRGAKVAAFMVDGRELICLPQAFELFLKHLVGGLHTVYTKLKRLDITPVVCNVEQVRILRGLGAIQPGVNRCKLISCKEFDILYDDCTNSNARPGRPPKRSPSIHASPETIEKLKKSRMDGGDFQFDPRLYGEHKAMLNGFPPHPYAALGPLPFLPMGHPLMSPPVSMAMASHLAMRADSQVAKDRAVEHDILARQREERLASIAGMYGAPPLPDHHLTPRHTDIDPNKPLNLQVNGHLKDSKLHGMRSDDDDDDDLPDDDKLSDDDHNDDLDNSLDAGDGYGNSDLDKSSTVGAPTLPTPTTGLLNGEQAMPSIETLLMNIQGLIKVATDTARHQERQIGQDKADLKMELMREREMRQALEKQLMEEQKNRMILQRRLRKEKKARRRLQEQAEQGSVSGQGLASGSQNVGLDLAVKPPSSPESSRTHLEGGESDAEGDKGGSVSDSERKLSESSDGRGSQRDMYDVFSAAAAHASSSAVTSAGSPIRFPPYLNLVASEVQ